MTSKPTNNADRLMIESKTYNHTKNTNIEYYWHLKTYRDGSNVNDSKDFDLGYTLFKIIETLEFVEQWNGEPIKDTIQDICNKYYSDAADFFNIYLSNNYVPILIDFTFRKQIWAIKTYLDLCSEKSDYCSIEYLMVLASWQLLEVKPLTQFIGISVSKKYFSNADNKEIIRNLFNDYDKNKNNSPLFYSCEYDSLIELCMSSIQCIFNEGYLIKKCENCGKFFIPFNRSDTIYCDRISPQDFSKTCKEYGAIQSYKEKLRTDKAAGLYRAIYMQKQMLLRRNPDIEEYKSDFENYKIKSKQWKIDVKTGLKSEEEYLTCLENIKRNK